MRRLKMKRVAMPIWTERIAPVFDASQKLLLVDIDGGRELSRAEELTNWPDEPRRVSRLQELGVDVLICGGISRRLAEMIETCGIRVIPWVGGFVDEVLSAYLAGRFPDSRFLMPGRRGRGRRRGDARGCRKRGRQ